MDPLIKSQKASKNKPGDAARCVPTYKRVSARHSGRGVAGSNPATPTKVSPISQEGHKLLARRLKLTAQETAQETARLTCWRGSLLRLGPDRAPTGCWPFGCCRRKPGVLTQASWSIELFRFAVVDFVERRHTGPQSKLPEMKGAGRGAESAVGFLNGVLGGATGLAGILPTIWTGLRGP